MVCPESNVNKFIKADSLIRTVQWIEILQKMALLRQFTLASKISMHCMHSERNVLE